MGASKQILVACLAAMGAGGTAAPFFQNAQIGQNVPKDVSFTAMPVFANRTLAIIASQTISQFVFSNGNLPDSSKDPVTGLPTTAFSIKYCDGVGQTLAANIGTWCVKYQSTVKRTLAASNTTLLTDTFSGGQGMVTFNYTGAQGLVVSFDGPVTALPEAYNPTLSAMAIAGNTMPFWDPSYLQACGAYSYQRFMDVAAANQDYVNLTTNTWPASNDWSTRVTPTTFASTTLAGQNRGIPLEWMLNLCAQTGKPGWFNVPMLASDDYITQYATMIATSQSAGTQAMFECLGNETWNTSLAFFNWHKRGAAALAETLFGTSVAIYDNHTQRVVGVTFDGTNATVQFLNPHGLSVGVSTNIVAVQGALTPYTGMNLAASTNTHFTVIDANNVSFPCTVAASGGQIAGTTIFGSSGSGVGAGVALNAGSNLYSFSGTTGAYALGGNWFFRRSWQAASLIRAAWTAAGRSLSDCKTILPFQAGTSYASMDSVRSALTSIFSAPLSSVFSAATVGGYFNLTLNNGGTMTSGFGFTQTASTPTDSSSVLSQLRLFVDHAYGSYLYSHFGAFCKANGLEMYGYELGVDTSNATAAAAAATANADPLMEGIVRDWLLNLSQLGFTRVGWYQCGAGTYSGTGCFNVGQTAAEANYLSGAAASPKVKGIVDAQSPPATLPVAYHAFPCTLNAFDAVGNEGVTVGGTNVWPNLAGSNFPYAFALCAGPNSSGMTYCVWSEKTQTVTVTVNGQTIGGAVIPVTVQNGNGTPGTFTAANGIGAPSAGVTLGSCTITLNPGMNWVLISTTTAVKGNCYLHAVQFS